MPGDVLILTKPLGTGLINTAVKAELASQAAAEKAVESMTSLNKAARDVTCTVPGSLLHGCDGIFSGRTWVGNCKGK